MEIAYRRAEIAEVARRLLADHGHDAVYTLTGDLGSGKTTLVAEMCRQLGTPDPVSSPTFSIVNTYRSPEGDILHLDGYRLEDTAEALAAGLEETLATAEYAVFVEWPAVIQPLLPADVVSLRLRHDPQDPQRRRLSITPGPVGTL